MPINFDAPTRFVGPTQARVVGRLLSPLTSLPVHPTIFQLDAQSLKSLTESNSPTHAHTFHLTFD